MIVLGIFLWKVLESLVGFFCYVNVYRNDVICELDWVIIWYNLGVFILGFLVLRIERFMLLISCLICGIFIMVILIKIRVIIKIFNEV